MGVNLTARFKQLAVVSGKALTKPERFELRKSTGQRSHSPWEDTGRRGNVFWLAISNNSVPCLFILALALGFNDSIKFICYN